MSHSVGVPVSGNYQPNGSLPLWSPTGEGTYNWKTNKQTNITVIEGFNINFITNRDARWSTLHNTTRHAWPQHNTAPCRTLFGRKTTAKVWLVMWMDTYMSIIALNLWHRCPARTSTDRWKPKQSRRSRSRAQKLESESVTKGEIFYCTCSNSCAYEE